MKQYKEFKEINGIQLKNIKFFPSREWGDEGGFSFDIYLHGKKIGYLFNAGDGGEEEVDLNLKPEETKEFYNLVKKSIPDFYYRLQIQEYKREGYPDFYAESIEKDRVRTEGKQGDLIEFLDYCEYRFAIDRKKSKSIGIER